MDTTNTNTTHHQPQSPPQQPPQPPTGYPPYHHLLAQQQQQLQSFWSYQRQEIEQANDFKNHQLPLARIKKIMKADEDVRMISAEAPILFAKACELFILELTIRSWLHAEENKRRTLQKNDIAAAITRAEIFDFLVDIVPREEIKEEGIGMGMGPGVGQTAVGGVPYYYPPMGAVGGVMMGQPAAVMYGAAGSQPWQNVWQNAVPGVGVGGGNGDESGYGNGGGGGGGNGGGQGHLEGQR